jgi:hypothetical protein
VKILAQMLGLLTSAYRKSDEHRIANNLPLGSNIGRVFSVFGWGLELIQENAERVRLWANIDHAKGKVLDRYGANFGVHRGGANDMFYRLMIKTKILSQISGGDMETVIGAIASLYEIDPFDNIEINEVFPAKLQIILNEPVLPAWHREVRTLVWALIKRIIAAGVGLEIIYRTRVTVQGSNYIGGKVTTQFMRVRLAAGSAKLPEKLTGSGYINGQLTAQFGRIRLPNSANQEGSYGVELREHNSGRPGLASTLFCRGETPGAGSCGRRGRGSRRVG